MIIAEMRSDALRAAHSDDNRRNEERCFKSSAMIDLQDEIKY